MILNAVVEHYVIGAVKKLLHRFCTQGFVGFFDKTSSWAEQTAI